VFLGTDRSACLGIRAQSIFKERSGRLDYHQIPLDDHQSPDEEGALSVRIAATFLQPFRHLLLVISNRDARRQARVQFCSFSFGHRNRYSFAEESEASVKKTPSKKAPGSRGEEKKMGAWSGEELKKLYGIMCPKKVRPRQLRPLPRKGRSDCRDLHVEQTGVKWDEVASPIEGGDVKACMNKVRCSLRPDPMSKSDEIMGLVNEDAGEHSEGDRGYG